MRQLYLPKHKAAQTIVLEGEDFHYLFHVLRMRKNDKITLIFKSGDSYRAEITSKSDHSCTLTMIDEIDRRTMGTEIILIQAIPKGKKMDQIIRQATECGVTAIQPVETEYCQVKLNTMDIQKKTDRWKKIIKEALQQSGSSVVTRIEKPCLLKDIQPISEQDGISLFFHQSVLALNSLHGYLSSCPYKVVLFVGSEGGLSPGEIDFLTNIGFRAAYLGETILRSETAAVFAIAAVKTLLQEFQSWILKK